MAGLLTPKIEPAITHLFNDIAVADLGPLHVDADAVQMTFQPEVRHHRGHKRVARKPPVRLPARGDKPHDLVPVDLAAGFVDQDQAVSVTVKAQTHVGTGVAHLGGSGFRMGRATIFVNIQTIGSIGDRDHIGPELPQNGGGHAVSSPVGAVDNDAQTIQAQLPRKGRLNIFDVT